MDFSNYKFRCHALGRIMPGPNEKAGELQLTTQKELRSIWIHERYGRRKALDNKYVRKGLLAEEDSITLYARVKKRMFKKNEERLENDYVSGVPDMYEGPSIRKATRVNDFKSSWDIFTFWDAATAALIKDYEWQIQGYCWLTGAPEGSVAHCLVSMPEPMLSDQRNYFFYKSPKGPWISPESPDFEAAWEEEKKNYVFDDIPLNERLVEHEAKRNDNKLEQIAKRVVVCRNYLNKLEEDHLRRALKFEI